MADNWWAGKALDQSTHEQINARHWPGTRQLCIDCGNPTGRCEDDSIFVEETGPLCEECRDFFKAIKEARANG